MLRIGHTCGEPACCRYPEHVEAYLGTTPRADKPKARKAGT